MSELPESSASSPESKSGSDIYSKLIVRRMACTWAECSNTVLGEATEKSICCEISIGVGEYPSRDVSGVAVGCRACRLLCVVCY